MYRQFFSALESTSLPLASMVFFLLAFALVLLRTLWLKSKRDYDPIATLPLEDGAPCGSAVVTLRDEVKR